MYNILKGYKEMSQIRVTAKGLCIYCKSKLKECLECGEMFSPKREDHVRCSSKCRTRKSRRDKEDS